MAPPPSPIPTQVLIVEDDHYLAANLATAFSLKQITSVLADTGAEALDLALNKKPRLIVLDLLLPKVSGFDVLKSLKANEATKDIPVLVASVLSAREEQDKALSLGAVGFLAKDELTPEDIVTQSLPYLK